MQHIYTTRGLRLILLILATAATAAGCGGSKSFIDPSEMSYGRRDYSGRAMGAEAVQTVADDAPHSTLATEAGTIGVDLDYAFPERAGKTPARPPPPPNKP